MQLFNVIFRQLLRALDLKQVWSGGEGESVIWQGGGASDLASGERGEGYVSAISQYDGGLMLMFDSAYKLLRTDSTLDFM